MNEVFKEVRAGPGGMEVTVLRDWKGAYREH